uniref:Ig-like domain-containing protein n=1 Tax=Laticauda laticaudata TaxID=8630 RepID=A0A8C5ST39_LATLA
VAQMIIDLFVKNQLKSCSQPFLSQTPEKEKAKEGETIVFGCQYNSPQGSSLNNLTVKWYKQDGKGRKDVMENNVTALENNTRIFMTGNLSEGDASLTILKVTASDHGTYYCQVILSNGDVVTGDGTKLRIQRALGKILFCFLKNAFRDFLECLQVD